MFNKTVLMILKSHHLKSKKAFRVEGTLDWRQIELLLREKLAQNFFCLEVDFCVAMEERCSL